ncbi:hypothetical protein K1719_031945 [Acacia pycnantha]|nr:hypothetical protein K1719_031945 [Acacia pycnantha]
MPGGEQGGLCQMPNANRGFQIVMFFEEVKSISQDRALGSNQVGSPCFVAAKLPARYFDIVPMELQELLCCQDVLL